MQKLAHRTIKVTKTRAHLAF